VTTVDDAIDQLRLALDKVADEGRIHDYILSVLQDLRNEYRRSPISFSSDAIHCLKRISELADAIHEFKEAQEDAWDARTNDEAAEVLGRFDGLREKLWPPLLGLRLDKEIRQLVEKSTSLPSSDSLRRNAERKRLVFDLESQAPMCGRCGERMVLRETRASAFWGCSTFPKCFARQWLTKLQKGSLGGA
jgi:hypothetical protein